MKQKEHYNRAELKLLHMMVSRAFEQIHNDQKGNDRKNIFRKTNNGYGSRQPMTVWNVKPGRAVSAFLPWKSFSCYATNQ